MTGVVRYLTNSSSILLPASEAGSARSMHNGGFLHEPEEVLSRNRPGDILFVGHGAAGTLLFCHYARPEIDRLHDQPAGGGYFFAFAREGRRILHSWRRMEEL